LGDEERLAQFEQAILPHLDAAYNLARWLTHNEHDAQDVVQEAYLRAYQFFGGFHGEDGRAWILRIVRNTGYTWMEHNRRRKPAALDEENRPVASSGPGPDSDLMQSEDRQLLGKALEELPREYREIVVLRDLEGLSYKEIAAVAGIPMGTVMSRLARARERLQQSLTGRMNREP
jgi:RNA polymerase sigma-70 factor (ECF subfamily)